eukprot:12775499-Alexandrium_andersonii.AAC.1
MLPLEWPPPAITVGSWLAPGAPASAGRDFGGLLPGREVEFHGVVHGRVPLQVERTASAIFQSAAKHA